MAAACPEAAGRVRVRAGEARQGVRGTASPVDLASVDTIVTSPEHWQIQATDAMTPHRARLAARYAAAGTPWHLARAHGLGLPMIDRMALCGDGRLVLRDPKGQEHVSGIACRQPLCRKCEDKRRAKDARRLRLAARQADARNKARHRVPHLLTFTVRDTGDPAADRDVMMRAWAKWRAWWAARAARAAQRHGRSKPAGGWGFDFALVVEVTPGTQRQGHAHLHVVAWLPKWWKWSAGAAQWQRTTGGNVDIGVRTHKGGSNPAAYLAKYVSKGSRIEGLPGEVAGDYLGQTYGKRRITSSRGFWLVERQSRWELVECVPVRLDTKGLRGWWLEATSEPWLPRPTTARAQAPPPPTPYNGR